MATTYKEVGAYLESVARTGKYINYVDLLREFPDLPTNLFPFPQNPLSLMFEELDREDNTAKRAFRTSLVVSKEHGIPGDGYFKMLERMRGQAVAKSDRLAVWLHEFNRVIAEYSE